MRLRTICQDGCTAATSARMFARGIVLRRRLSETRFAPREGNVNAELDEILELTPETYAARFRGSAMKRAKLSGLQRNARALLSCESAESCNPD